MWYQRGCKTTAGTSQRSQPNWVSPDLWETQSFFLRHEIAVASADRACARFPLTISATPPACRPVIQPARPGSQPIQPANSASPASPARPAQPTWPAQRNQAQPSPARSALLASQPTSPPARQPARQLSQPAEPAADNPSQPQANQPS